MNLPGTEHIIYRAEADENGDHYFCTKHGRFLSPPSIVSDGSGEPFEACEDCIIEGMVKGDYKIEDATERIEILCKITASCTNIAEDECAVCGMVACAAHMDPGGYTCQTCAQNDKETELLEDMPTITPEILEMQEQIQQIIKNGGKLDA